MRSRLRSLLYRHLSRILTAPLGSYLRSSGQDVEQLKRHCQKGDVLLVCGDQRVSEVIRYLTQSSWSHAAIYVGDELLRRHPERAAELEARFGDDARHLVVEALIDEGVVASPLAKYRGFHLRLCRPFGIEPPDLETVLGLVIEQMGGEYDLTNLIDLARYFLPVSLVPARFRRDALVFGSGRPTEVICSSMIARAFDAVGFPILPRTASENGQPVEPPIRSLLARLVSDDGVVRRYHAGPGAPSWPSRRPLARDLRLHRPPHGLITPRDFDLSPYFEIVKFSLIEGNRREDQESQRTRSVAGALARASSAGRAVAMPLWSRFRRAPRPAVLTVAAGDPPETAGA